MSQLLVAAAVFEDGDGPFNSFRGSVKKDDEVGAWLTSAALANYPYLAPDAATVPRTRDDFPARRIDDVSTCIETCRQAVEERGMEVLVLDQTRADTGMPCVKVVVPGLRHFFARFGPGRLYDVPVAMGLLEAPVPEEELNPTLMFF